MAPRVVNRISGVVAILIGFSLAPSCSRPPTDDRLISEFGRNKPLFDQIAALSVSTNLDCPYPNDPDVCVPRSSGPVLSELKRKTGFADMQLWVRNGKNIEIHIPVEVTGILSTSSSVFGYVYCTAALNPLVDTVWQDLEQREAYRRIEGNWYLWIAN
jgi:hypothetical protein